MHDDMRPDAAGLTANGRPRASRASQFMPFAALTGYYELARQQERITKPRHELTDEEALELSRTIIQVKKGDLVRVTYYDWDAYHTVSGVIAPYRFRLSKAAGRENRHRIRRHPRHQAVTHGGEGASTASSVPQWVHV